MYRIFDEPNLYKVPLSNIFHSVLTQYSGRLFAGFRPSKPYSGTAVLLKVFVKLHPAFLPHWNPDRPKMLKV